MEWWFGNGKELASFTVSGIAPEAVTSKCVLGFML
jgi:hypothetical protein